MPTAKKLPSGSWRCQVYSHTEDIKRPDGTVKKKRIYKSFTCDDPSPKGKRKAEKEATAWAATKESVSKRIDKTYGELLDEYIEARSAVLSPSTIREYKRSRKADLQNLMDKKLFDITQEDIQLEINRAAMNHSPKSIRNMHGLISAVMGVYRPDFALNTDLPRKVRPKLYIPTDGDVKRLMETVAGTPMEIPVLLAAFGPMRRGEICALDKDHIQGNIVHVEFSMALDENNQWVIKAPKSIAGDRYIEFPDFVILKLQGKTGRIVGLTPSQVSDRFSDILVKAGIPHFRFHDLRHYSASIQHALGIPDAYIMKRGGWEDDAVLKDVYRHTMEEQAKLMNAKANSYFSQLTNVASLPPTQQRILTLFESLGIPSYLCTNAIIRIAGNKKEEEVIDALENVLRLVGPLIECNTKSNTKSKNP
ncbi:MAG: site-specific integrase [Clostridioides difficile]|nr:site-specific integrase [Clostridioides difficile]